MLDYIWSVGDGPPGAAEINHQSRNVLADQRVTFLIVTCHPKETGRQQTVSGRQVLGDDKVTEKMPAGRPERRAPPMPEEKNQIRDLRFKIRDTRSGHAEHTFFGKQSQQVIENTKERPKIGQTKANLGLFGCANGPGEP